MTVRLYNTMTRSVQDLEPVVPGRVTLYSCGPTVWNYAHIGNFRTFLFVDLLRRWIAARGHEVYHIMNLTDVDDRIITEAGKRGVSIDQLVTPYIAAFHQDREYLRILPAHDFPRATDYVEAMVRLVAGLLDNGTAYKGDDGSVYFGIDRFPAYGKLSRLDLRELKAGASGRVSTDEYDKENARDFVLWKAAKPEDEAVSAAWDAPFGRGRPGWHLECSAMALELIGKRYGATVLDIHTGAVDLIFPHHEDEIAQSCAFTGQPDFARVWMHAAFLRVSGAKMSKRFGNITTARDLREDGVDPGAIRLLVYQTHYRQELDLTDAALAAAGEGARRLGEFDRRLMGAAGADDDAAFLEAADRFERGVAQALDDDLNAPRAVAEMFDFVSTGNRLLDQGNRAGPRALAAWRFVDGVLDAATRITTMEIRLRKAAGAEEALPEAAPADATGQQQWAEAWAGRRLAARGRRNFAEADRIRGLLGAAGWQVRDKKDGGSEVSRA